MPKVTFLLSVDPDQIYHGPIEIGGSVLATDSTGSSRLEKYTHDYFLAVQPEVKARLLDLWNQLVQIAPHGCIRIMSDEQGQVFGKTENQIKPHEHKGIEIPTQCLLQFV
ncbi:MAG: hypothetical protein V1487_03150 [bacterium]